MPKVMLVDLDAFPTYDLFAIVYDIENPNSHLLILISLTVMNVRPE